MHRRNVAADAHGAAADASPPQALAPVELFNTTLDICEERAQSKHSADWANLSTWGGLKTKTGAAGKNTPLQSVLC